ncbi:MAG TPA: efflux RND transporter permease subunit [Chthoniobacterales bacterium]
MWIVQLALRRPYTFIVAAVLLLIASPLVILRTPVDIFPNIDIPVVSIVFQYAGMPASQFADRITSPFERLLTTTVNNIEHIESTSLNGISVTRVFFQSNTSLSTAIAQVTAISQTVLKQLPTGITPPIIITYNASSVPILQLGLSSDKLSEQRMYDLGINYVRTAYADVPGAAIPYPFGGKQRQIMIDIDPSKLTARGLSPADVVNAISSQNLVLPSGTVKLGSLESDVEVNASPDTVNEIANLPIESSKGAIVYVRDIGSVRDGFTPQTNIVRQNGQRGVLLSVYKSGTASTVSIVDTIRQRLPQILTTLPPELNIRALFDQSIFVRASIKGVLTEAIIAALLTAVMILLFLGNWRHTMVVAISIPLSVLASICALSFLGESLNIMTLGGLALAVGILVDDATVTIENIDRYLEKGGELNGSILQGAAQIAVPALVSTMCICIVFLPMFFLAGVARYLFVPLAEAVVFAMLASYIISRTLVPTLMTYFLRRKHRANNDQPKGFFARFHASFEHSFAGFREWYTKRLEVVLGMRWRFVIPFLCVCLLSVGLLATVGHDFFPTVDAGQFRLHMRARTATRIEETANYADQVENFIRSEIPKSELENILDNIGLPYSGINTSYSNNGTIGTADVEMLCSLNEGRHGPTSKYVARLRHDLPKRFPQIEFFFQSADIISQILNFGVSAPIDIQFVGRDTEGNLAVARDVAERVKRVAGAVDTHIYQLFNQPKFDVNVNRSKANELGLTEHDVSNSLLVSLSNSFQVSPSFYLNSANHIVYNLSVAAPQYRVQTLDDLLDLPITSANGKTNQLLVNLASFERKSGPALVTTYNLRPVVDILCAVQGRDLGGVARDIGSIVDDARKHLPRGSEVVIRGQVQTMNASFAGLAAGLIGAVILVYLLIVVNFQSWLDPFIILTSLPGALAGISWILFLTGTTLSVPALMGAIMCVGVATANSILVVTFARDQFAQHHDAFRAALDAGRTRLRPVLMTAAAMIIGMIPMSLGLGEGGEQNAPLGRAVIGGLLCSTIATLFFVPTIFALFRSRRSTPANASEQPKPATSA